MKIFVPFFFFIISILDLHAQSIFFEKPFGNIHRINISDIAEKPQGGYVLCGFTADTFPSRGYVATLDSAGNLEWENEIYAADSDFHVDHILALDSDQFILQCSVEELNGSYAIPKLFTMSNTGVITDTFLVDISGVWGFTQNINLLKGPGTNFWTITHIGIPGPVNRITIVQHNKNLDTLYTLETSDYYNHQYSSNNDGKLAILSEVDDWDTIQGSYSDDVISIYNEFGNLVFNTALLYNLPHTQDFILRNDQGFTAFHKQQGTLDTIITSTYDSAGILLNEKKNSGNNLWAGFATVTSDSGYFLVLTNYDTINYQTINRRIYKFNNADDTLWSVDVFRNYLVSVIAVEATLDGGCILIFHSNNFGDTLNYILKIGPNGENVTSTNEKNIGSSNYLIYPNPTTGTFSISNLPPGEFQLNIFDFTGSEIFSEKIIDISQVVIHPEFSPGIYFVRINNENKFSYSAKVIIN